jgi:hypothetical protein
MLDLRTVVYALRLPFLCWFSAVIVVAIGGRQPGVVCITPLAWLMSLWVGLRAVAYTQSPERSVRLKEATVAGSCLGFLQGVLFIAIAPMMGGIKHEEMQRAIVLSVLMIFFGIVVCGGLSCATAATQEKHRVTK